MHVNGVIQTWTIKPYQNGWSLENVKGTLPTFFLKINVIMTLRGGDPSPTGRGIIGPRVLDINATWEVKPLQN